MRNLIIMAAVGAASFLSMAPAGADILTWDFIGGDSTVHGSGLLTVDNSGVVTALSGTYEGQVLSLVTFTSDPNNPGAQLNNADGMGHDTYHGVPNTGGADYIFDNLLDLTLDGILVSTGTGDSERVYDLSLNPDTPDFFSVNPDGSYRDDFGTFNTSPADAAVPEPAAWALMISGFGLVGGALRRTRQTVSCAA